MVHRYLTVQGYKLKKRTRTLEYRSAILLEREFDCSVSRLALRKAICERLIGEDSIESSWLLFIVR
jgi:hypothetical protein